MIPMVQQHVNGCIEAGANFMILPELGADINQGPGTRLNRSDSLLVTMFWDVRAEVGTNCQCRTWDNQAGTLLI